MPACAGGRRGAHVPCVPRHRARPAMYRRGRRRTRAGGPARHAATLRREPRARRPRIHRARRACGHERGGDGKERAMRTLFLLPLLANIAFFGWSRYIAPPEASADHPPLGRQIDPEKMKVIAPGELPAVTARPAPAPVALKCIEWGSFTLADAPRAEKALEPLALGTRLAQRKTEESAGWWVFIPAQPNRQAALRKAAELRNLGVEDYF